MVRASAAPCVPQPGERCLLLLTSAIAAGQPFSARDDPATSARLRPDGTQQPENLLYTLSRGDRIVNVGGCQLAPAAGLVTRFDRYRPAIARRRRPAMTQRRGSACGEWRSRRVRAGGNGRVRQSSNFLRQAQKRPGAKWRRWQPRRHGGTQLWPGGLGPPRVRLSREKPRSERIGFAQKPGGPRGWGVRESSIRVSHFGLALRIPMIVELEIKDGHGFCEVSQTQRTFAVNTGETRAVKPWSRYRPESYFRTTSVN